MPICGVAKGDADYDVILNRAVETYEMEVGIKSYDPIVIAKDTKPISKIVKAIIAAKEQNPNADTSKLEAQLDNEVYALYGIEGKDRELIEKNYA